MYIFPLLHLTHQFPSEPPLLTKKRGPRYACPIFRVHVI